MMMKHLRFVALICLFPACKKNNEPSKTTPILSGTFTLYKKADTSYLQSPGKDVPTDIIILSSPGDTTYVFSGQNSFTVLLNSIPNYDPSISLADTLSFTSETAGSENGIDFPVAGKFTYSLNSGYFKINNVDFSGTYAIKEINSSMVELIIISNSGGVETEGQTLFFRKK